MDTESLIIALLAIAAAGIGYHLLRRRKDARGSAPEHFFGGLDEETALHDTRASRLKD